MKNKIALPTIPSEIKDYFVEALASPPTQALLQLTPISAAIGALANGEYSRKKQEEITNALHLLQVRLESVEKRYLDNEFYASEKGKRVFEVAFASLIKDSRLEKVEGMSNLLTNLAIKTKISYDERELFVDILDILNPFQLSVLGRIHEFNKESKPALRKFESAGIASFFEDKGIYKDLTHQAIAVLATHYLINKANSATIGGSDITHYTEFGERFYIFISEVLPNDSPYLLI